MITIIKTIAVLFVGFTIGAYQTPLSSAIQPRTEVIEYQVEVCAADDIGLVWLSLKDVEGQLR